MSKQQRQPGGGGGGGGVVTKFRRQQHPGFASRFHQFDTRYERLDKEGQRLVRDLFDVLERKKRMAVAMLMLVSAIA